MSPAPPRAARAPGSIRSVAVGAALLKAVGGLRGPASLGEIARVAGMSPSRTHRYLSSLVQHGLIQQDPVSGQYDLGTTLVELGLNALGRIDAVRLGAESLARLTRRTGLDSHLNVWGSHGPTVIKWEHGHLGYAIRVREGRNFPLIQTATGRVFLTYLPPEETAAFVQAELRAQKRDAPRRFTMKDVAAIRAEVRRHGIARSFEEYSAGISALSAPVFDHNDRLCMGITLVAVNVVMPADFNAEPAVLLGAAAAELSRRLGAQTLPAPGADGAGDAATRPAPRQRAD